ncbi:LOW QUALITY PROTEIN: uncharacterized protein LOC133509016 [Syngnathoides biaculeatus]|uniref:LOW QUALITY PROTEIN: uncharacterized protein LOC133509016 n=1 Tax=Syngnathoides biaculeatus TaxID=300417 RepID=UPI002ADE54F2|nr:LOW QUALITY PROTEIN: uncharacterized protein LOC133509016 [Syngnathoides biaculeatus]
MTMGNATNTRENGRSRFVFFLSLLVLFGEQAAAQVRYSVPEEVQDGTVVGNIAKDLGLDVSSLADRRFRVVSGSEEAIFDVNPDNGALYVRRHIDREELCQGGAAACLAELKILVENPLEIHYVLVQIVDVNDHAPSFPEAEQTFEIAEHTLPGRRFPLHAARDPDAGLNSIRAYTLTPNEHFEINVRQSDAGKVPFLVLKKSLDREHKHKHSLVVTAADGGKPALFGALNVSVIVLDSNDNRPIFSQDIYEITIAENIEIGSRIFQMNATDPDEGTNGEIEYIFSKTLSRDVSDIFELDKLTGEIRVRGKIDYEENDIYELDIDASDKATPPMTGECRVIIEIKDVNDNVPQIEVTSLSNKVSEDSKPGTVISLISVTDKDSGANAKIMSRITNNVPFELKPAYKENTYSVVTKTFLDREDVSHYELMIEATDFGEPPMSAFKSLNVQVADVNDNGPHFEHNPLEFYLLENNIAGKAIFSLSAMDKDMNENAAISYQICRGGKANDITSFLNINSETGEVTALKSLDFEALKSFQFQVSATDGGRPPLSGNVTVKVFILDQNDNAPVIVYPLSSNGSAQGAEEIPRNSKAGDLVTRVRAYDADSGYNGWLLFSLHPPSERALFSLDRYTGQIRTLRSFTETDEAEHRLLVLVKDNGDVSLSATATVTVKLAEPKEAFAASDHVQSAAEADRSEDRLTFYLALTLGSVSLLLVISVVVLIAMRCSKSTEYTSKYLQDPHYDGTLCHSIQYRSGDKRYMLVGPRMSIGSTVVPGSRANTLLMSDAAGAGGETFLGFYLLPSCLRSEINMEEKRGRKTRSSLCVLLPFCLLLFFAQRALAELRYSIPEEMAAGTVVGNVAKDLGLDRSALSGRRFRVVSGSADAYFQVNTEDGSLQARRKIDREELCHGSGACFMELKILLENPLEVHYVVVEITDVNDHSPVFLEKKQLFEIAEHSSPGSRFELHAAGDPDAAINSVRTYTLAPNEHFELDIVQSDNDKIPYLVLKRSLDREQRSQHLLYVTAVDGGKPPRSATLNVSIVVLDINDNRPIFQQDTYNVEIDENVPTGTLVARVNATDPDEGTNGKVEFRFSKTLTPRLYEMFEIDAKSGIIRSKGPVDFEETEIYNLLVEAYDRGTPPLTSKCRVVVRIKDVNDNPPVIEVTSLSSQVSEDAKPGTVVALVSVVDKDSGINGKMISKITDNVPFELKPSYKDNTYSVVTKGFLDREEVSRYEITIQATDCGDPPLSTFKTFDIELSDVNDNSPHFDQSPYKFYLFENNVAGASVFSLRATDNDANENAVIQYKIVAADKDGTATSFLTINSETGEVTALKSLDFEALKSFQFQVSATDGGRPPLSGNVTVKVFILDQNDNAPVIVYPLSSNGSAQGAEEIPRNSKAGDLVTRVRAYDADTGYNGWLLFSLHPPGERALFSLDRYTGQIRTLRSFTETDGAEHRLLVLVKDNGDVSLSATATVTVKLAEPKEAFAASDHVQSAAEADRSEDRLTFYLALTLGSVSLLLVISVVVLIAMRCSKSTEYTSKYLQDPHYDGTLCHSIQYRSGDKRYMLVGPRMSIGSTVVPGSRANTLLMSDAAGEVRTLQPVIGGYKSSRLGAVCGSGPQIIRRKRGAVISGIRRVCVDYGERKGPQPLAAFCLCLHFLREPARADLRYSVPEEVKAGSVVGNVAKDLGLDKASLLDRQFRVVSGSKEAFFHVRPENGALEVRRKIDREALCQGSAACVMELKILVENPLEMHHVVVEITDVNDNSPSFSDKEQVFEIAEHSSPGTRFQLQAARDPDGGINSVRAYTLTPNEHFELDTSQNDDEKTPFLVLKRPLDREQNRKHSLFVTAVDGGKPQRSATLNVTIIVLDINDNRPTFSRDTYAVEMKEDVPVGVIIIKVNATDPDEGPNGEIEYSLGKIVNKAHDIFELDKQSGLIKLKGAVDFEDTQVYKLDIQASDKGQPPLTGRCRVIVKIKDVNDNPPEIEVTSLTSKVPEDSKPGTVVSLISVSDKDSGANGKISSQISSHVPFELKPSYKENIFSVVTKENLDREKVSDYQITITATDCGQPPLSAFQTLNIQISDVNDNKPQFHQSPLSFYLSENNIAGQSIFSVSATDNDANENAAISYNIIRAGIENEAASFLNINSETGEVTALKSLDFEALKSFQFQVSAADGGRPPLSGNVTVKVFILDQNDNAPVIVYPLSSNGSTQGAEEIPRNSKAGDLVTRVRAYDADTGYNGWLLFSLHPPGERALFSLDRYTGQIRTLRSFTETDEAEHRLLVLVKDNGDVSLSATATVTVKLAEPKEAFAASDHVQSAAEADRSEDRLTFYLALTLGSVSLLLVISVVVLIAMRCSKSTEYTSKYLQDPHYDGTLCHSIQYRSGDKRYMLVGPRMSIGSTVVPGSRANTLLMSDAAGAAGQTRPLRLLFLKRFLHGVVPSLQNGRIIIRCLHGMEQRRRGGRGELRWWLAFVLILCNGARAQLRYSVAEEVAEGTAVGNIAKDLGLDKGALRGRGYRIVAASAEPILEVNQDDGILYVARRIDREEVCVRLSPCVLNLKTVLEHPLEVHYVAVEILDVNDHSPVFPEKEKRLEISESATPGARFQLQGAQDPDVGQFSIQQYKLAQSEYFRVEVKDRGQDRKVPFLVLIKQLDRETKGRHHLRLTAVDGGKPPKSGSIEIIVDVLDVNDNSPVFDKEVYSVSLKENVPAGTVVIRVNATDLDQGANGEVVYSLGKEVDSKVRHLFSIDPKTGEIQVTGQIDFEESQSYVIDIQASDKGPVPLTTDKSVSITIIDENDNAPEIEVTSFSNAIKEDAKIGTTVALISVSDLDSGMNGQVLCTIKQDGPFTLAPSLQENMYAVVIKSRLDREEVSQYDVTIMAKDTNEPVFSTEKTISVVVSDVNDNSPEFSSSPYAFYITENNIAGASVFSVKASDQDEGDNALISYQIISEPNADTKLLSFININPESGEVTALKSLDFEALKSFQFQVSATDGGSPPLSGNVTVKVFILDQNDNAPVIVYPLSSNGSAQGAEEIPRNSKAGDLVTRVRAYDADTGYNGWLLFSLHPPGERALFSLDRYTGQIRTLRSFTETDGAEHRLLVLVKDNGDVSLSATATVTVKLAEPKEAFAASDHVQSAAEADRSEDRLTFYLALTLGSVSLLLVISVVVLIAMRCSKSTEYTSKYLQDPHYDGTLCHSIQYRSGDKRYMLVGPRMSIGSTVVPGSRANTLLMSDAAGAAGEMSAASAFPRMDSCRFFLVTMEQRGARGRARRCLLGFAAALLLCSGTSAQLRYSISEEVEEGTVVGNAAKDLGLDRNALKERRYRIVSGSAEPLFHVSQADGVLYVSRKIDREKECPQSAACLINLKTVLENPLEVHSVGVEILDVNDHSPTFAEEETKMDIYESVLPGARFQLQAAHDGDSGHFSVQQYKLSENEHFGLEVKDKRKDGKIPILICKKALDRETAPHHSLVLTALDGGKPPKRGDMNISINVLDVNDNAPVFSKDIYSVMLHENAATGTTVVQVNARDLDEGTNGEVIYSFSKNNPIITQLFDMNVNTGEIVVKGPIDYEEKDIFEIEVQASDKGSVPLTTEKSVTIKVADVNDNAPEIEVTSFSSSIPEDSRLGTTVALISVNDLDSGPNGKVICSISQDLPFALSPSLQDKMYALVTKSPLDREKRSTYDISVVARDAGRPALSSEKTISVYVSDVNDNRPEFAFSPYTFYVAEGNKAGASVFSVQASDRDDGENAAITYRILREGREENKPSSFLSINSQSGEVTALKSFDFEALKSFQFQVSATDGGSPPLSGNVTVKVFILDQNDNAPVIVYPLSSNGSAQGAEEIPRNSKAGDLVTRVRAYDADTGYNGWLLFSLHPPGERSLFSLDRYTGQIRTLRSFTETDGAEHRLLVLVKDNGDVSLSATATVTVKLAEPKEAFAASDHVQSASEADHSEDRLSFYLALTLGSVSLLLVISVVVLIAMRCSKSTEYTSKYLQDAHYDGTLCHSIQYRSGDKRYMLVGPRMSIGSTIVPGSRANTLLMSDAAGEVRELFKESGSFTPPRFLACLVVLKVYRLKLFGDL